MSAEALESLASSLGFGPGGVPDVPDWVAEYAAMSSPAEFDDWPVLGDDEGPAAAVDGLPLLVDGSGVDASARGVDGVDEVDEVGGTSTSGTSSSYVVDLSTGEVVDLPDDLDDTQPIDDEERKRRGLATVDDRPKDNRGRWWAVIAWFDSIAPDWEARLSRRPDIRAVACWHDRDGMTKKHLHVMMGSAANRKWSEKQAREAAHDIFDLRCPGPDDRLVELVRYVDRAALYLTHANAPTKAQYRRDEILEFGNADYDSLCGAGDMSAVIGSEVRAWCRAFFDIFGVFPAYAALSTYAASRRSWASWVDGGGRRPLMTWLQSAAYDAGADGRGSNTMSRVDEILKLEADGMAPVDAMLEARERLLSVEVDGPAVVAAMAARARSARRGSVLGGGLDGEKVDDAAAVAS